MRLMRTYKYRLLPSKGQHKRLRAALDHSRDLYNAGLQERIEAYRHIGQTLRYKTQSAGITELRKDPTFTEFPVSLQRWPLKQLDHAFAAFFRRLKAGQKPGHPRFKGRDWYKTFGFTDRWGWEIEGSRLRMKGIGRVRLHLHRPLPSRPLSCAVKKDTKGWSVILYCETEAQPLQRTGQSIGLDLGISAFVATSEGEVIPSYRAARKAHTEMRRRQRHLARCKRGSNNRRKLKTRLAAVHGRVVNARQTHSHQVSARLVRENDLIAIENLNVKGLAASMLARDVHDAGWSTFTKMLLYKAESAGRTVTKVDCKYSSQTCPACGEIKPKALSERTHRCDCGCVLDRDVAAAKIILSRAVPGPVGHNVGSH